MKELINALRPSYSWLAGQLQEDFVMPDYETVRNNIRNSCNNNVVSQPSSSVPAKPTETIGDMKDISSKEHLELQSYLVLLASTSFF
jgi:hypothetical protein